MTHASNNESTLNYYKHDASSGKKSKSMPQPCGWIFLSDVRSFFEVEGNSASKGISQSLIIDHPARKFHLTAETVEEHFRWKTVLSAHCPHVTENFSTKNDFSIGRENVSLMSSKCRYESPASELIVPCTQRLSKNQNLSSTSLVCEEQTITKSESNLSCNANLLSNASASEAHSKTSLPSAPTNIDKLEEDDGKLCPSSETSLRDGACSCDSSLSRNLSDGCLDADYAIRSDWRGSFREISEALSKIELSNGEVAKRNINAFEGSRMDSSNEGENSIRFYSNREIVSSAIKMVKESEVISHPLNTESKFMPTYKSNNETHVLKIKHPRWVFEDWDSSSISSDLYTRSSNVFETSNHSNIINESDWDETIKNEDLNYSVMYTK